MNVPFEQLPGLAALAWVAACLAVSQETGSPDVPPRAAAYNTDIRRVLALVRGAREAAC